MHPELVEGTEPVEVSSRLTCQRSIASVGAGGQAQGANALIRGYAKSVVRPSLLAAASGVGLRGDEKPRPSHRLLMGGEAGRVTCCPSPRALPPPLDGEGWGEVRSWHANQVVGLAINLASTAKFERALAQVPDHEIDAVEASVRQARLNRFRLFCTYKNANAKPPSNRCI